MIIRWEDPPPMRAGRRAGDTAGQSTTDVLAPAADELRANPGRWGVVFEGHNASAAGIASRIRQAFSGAWAPPGAFEASARKIRGQTVTYVRYVGADGAQLRDEERHVKQALVAYATAPLGSVTPLSGPVRCGSCTEVIGVCGCFEKRLDRLARATDG